jgi:hypothetical protein
MTDSETPPEVEKPRTTLSRRTVVQGAAWSVPVIASAIATPLAAASVALDLAFNSAAYAGTACTTITGAQVSATSGGSPAPNSTVTVTLDSGYTFADGSTTFTGVTNGAGALALPAIRVPAEGGNANFLATSGAATVTAAVTAPPGGSFAWINTGTYAAAPAIPPGSTPAYGGLFLTLDHRLIDASGNLYASNVAEVGPGYGAETSSYHVGLRLTDGTFAWINSNVYAAAPAVPAGSKPVYGGLFLTPDARLVDASGTVYATNVAAVAQGYDGGPNWNLGIQHTDGSFGWISNNVYGAAPGVPAGSTPAYGRIFLTPDGRLVDQTGTVVYASNVASIGQGYASATDWHLPLMNADGTFGWLNNGTYTGASTIPAGSTPVWGGLFLTPDGRLIDVNGALYASNVESVGDVYDAGTSWHMGLKLRPTACAW